MPRATSIRYPRAGSGRWQFAGADRPGSEGARPVLRYRVAVERDIRGVTAARFADEVHRTLTDPRGWGGPSGAVRLRRVAAGARHDFTVFLATPDTRVRLCRDGSHGYTSCRLGDLVVVNVARWAKGAAAVDAPLPVYRRYMISHEVGHRLGHGHELCPGRGRPAPVMQQQTLGLHGCRPNPWPFPGGRAYHGKPGAYDDPVPTAP